VALSEDQKAILRLLAQRGAAGYGDLAALLGVSVEEVHARAQAAAEQLESEGIPAPAIPDPGGPPQPRPVEQGQPKAEMPKQRPKAALPKGEPKPPLRKELKLLENRGLWAILAGVAIIVVFLAILLVGGGGGSESSSTTGTAVSNCEKPTGPAPKPNGKAIAALAAATVKAGKEPTSAVLNPVDGSEARGLVVFGRVKNSLALQVVAEGLSPTRSCGGYTIWIAASPRKMLPLASTEVRKDGRINAQVEVPVEILAYLANETFGQIAITRTDESQLKASLAKATKEKKAPVYTGTEVLRGNVTGPIVGAAKGIAGAKR
jgi:hypothetical protein